MSDPLLLPEALLATGLTGLGVWAMRRPDQPVRWRELRFPRDLDATQVEAMLAIVAARRAPVVFVIETTPQSVRFVVGAGKSTLSSLASALAGIAPEVRLDEVATAAATPSLGGRAWWSSSWPLTRTDGADLAVSGLLGALSSAGGGEQLRLIIRTTPAPRRAPLPERDRPGTLRQVADKRSGPLLRAEVLLGVTAVPQARAIQLSQAVIAALRTLDGPRGRLRVRRLRATRARRALDQATRTSRWSLTPTTVLSPAELVPLVAWPIGAPRIAGLSYGSAPRLMPPVDLPRDSDKATRVFARSTWPGAEDRVLAASALAGTLHTAVIGGTGSGKSTLLAQLALQDIEAGRGALVLDLKGDLIPDLTERIPAHRQRDVILLDPASGAPQPGLTLFPAGADSELAIESLLGTFEQIWGASWGIRTAHYLRLGLRTLSEVPGATLLELPLLFDPAYRNRVLGGVSDAPVQRQWQRFAALSVAEQSAHASPVLTRLDQLLSRKHLRVVLGQSRPKLHFGEVLARGRIVLIRLPLGLLGPGPTRLLASCVVSQFLAAVEARAALPPERRHVFMAYLDEIAAVGSTPLGLEGALERARAHGVGLTLAPQHLGQLSPSLRASLLANCGSQVAFRLSADEAKAVARELPGVSAEQLQHLGRFEVALKLALGPGEVTPTMTGRTTPLGAPCSDPAAIRALSGERFGMTLEDVDAAFAQRLRSADGRASAFGDADEHDPPSTPVGAKRRAS